VSRAAVLREPVEPGALWLRWEMPSGLPADEEVRCGSAAGIASYLRRTFRFQGFRVEPLPFA
jgi:hypothetical protein